MELNLMRSIYCKKFDRPAVVKYNYFIITPGDTRRYSNLTLQGVRKNQLIKLK